MALQPKDYFVVDATLNNVTSNDYDALVLPGGLNSPDDLRLDENAVNFVRGFKNKPIAAICHGPWLLINADLVNGKPLLRGLRLKLIS